MRQAALLLWAASWLQAAAGIQPDCSAVPGWTQKGPLRTYIGENLYEYINGNSEGYLVYNFKRMDGVTCAKGEVELVFDISEMESPDFAWGILVSNRDPNRPVEKIGTAGQVGPRRAIFAKDKYFVEIAANPAGDHSQVLRAFLTHWEKKIPGSTKAPDAVGWFPEEGLNKDSVRLIPESVLGFRMLRRGYQALYAKGKAVVVPEASPEAASGLLAKLKDRIGNTKPAALGDEAFQADDKFLGRICIFRKGRFLAGFANLPADTDPLPLAQKLLARMP